MIMMKGMAAIEVIVILILALLIMAAIISFVLHTTTPAQNEIRLRSQFDSNCASSACGALITDATKTACQQLWSETNVNKCIKLYCPKCDKYFDANGAIVTNPSETNTALLNSVKSVQSNLGG